MALDADEDITLTFLPQNRSSAAKTDSLIANLNLPRSNASKPLLQRLLESYGGVCLSDVLFRSLAYI
jgi:hypothetical protein